MQHHTEYNGSLAVEDIDGDGDKEKITRKEALKKMGT